MLTEVKNLKPGDLFMWFRDVAEVVDIVAIPDHLLSTSEACIFSLEVKIPSIHWVGAVQTKGNVQVQLVKQ
jgi:hypothetical protein